VDSPAADTCAIYRAIGGVDLCASCQQEEEKYQQKRLWKPAHDLPHHETHCMILRRGLRMNRSDLKAGPEAGNTGTYSTARLYEKMDKRQVAPGRRAQGGADSGTNPTRQGPVPMRGIRLRQLWNCYHQLRRPTPTPGVRGRAPCIAPQNTAPGG
jgi:hypothetical protein